MLRRALVVRLSQANRTIGLAWLGRYSEIILSAYSGKLISFSSEPSTVAGGAQPESLSSAFGAYVPKLAAEHSSHSALTHRTRGRKCSPCDGHSLSAMRAIDSGQCSEQLIALWA